MSLKPTPKNHLVLGLALSAESWARHAIGSDKMSGIEGFENYRSESSWYHPMHYKYIRERPEWSTPEAIEEMSDVRLRLVEEIATNAKVLDRMVMRLQRMEEQMSSVLAQAAIDVALRGEEQPCK